MNARLRQAIATAKAESVPKDTIDRAIKRGTGEIAGPFLRNGKVTRTWNKDTPAYGARNKNLYQCPNLTPGQCCPLSMISCRSSHNSGFSFPIFEQENFIESPARFERTGHLEVFAFQKHL